MSEFSGDMLAAVGWAAMHLVWQAGLVALLYAVARRGLSAAHRYRLGLGALAMLLLLGSLTLTAALTTAQRNSDSPGVATTGDAATPLGSGLVGTARASSWGFATEYASGRRALPTVDEGVLKYFGAAWLLVAVASLVTLLGVRLLLARHSSHGQPLPSGIQSTAAALKSRLGLREGVRVVQAETVSYPMLFGVWRPVVLMPGWLVRDLPVAHTEALLAHELAHVRRRDYLANLIQLGAEVLLLRHPAVRWISSEIRRDRELCCDALAAQALGNPRLMAEALASLGQPRNSPFHLAQAVTEGDLLQRVRRLLGPSRLGRSRHGSFAQACALAILPFLAWPATLESPVRFERVEASVARGAQIVAVAVEPRAEAPLVLRGLDPVALLGGDRVAGDPAFERVHEGYRYRFDSARNAGRFDRDTAEFAVTNIEACPVTGNATKADIFKVVDGRIYLFCCEEAYHIPRPALETIVRAGGLAALLESGGAIRESTPLGRRIRILEPASGLP